MLITNKTITISGTSTVTQPGGEDVSVASMSASIGMDGIINVSSNIYNKELYEKHKKDVIADIQEFEKIVYEMDD